MKYTYDYDSYGNIKNIDKYILLSASPRRKELLSFLNPEVYSNNIDERAIELKFMDFYKDDDFIIRAAKTCCEISKEKSNIILEDNTMYISADTMVILEDKIYNKPKDDIEKREMFMSYFGKTHYVISAVCLRMKDYLNVFYTIAEVEFIDYYEKLQPVIDDYLAFGNVMDKAGAYGIQDLDPRFIKRISGDINTIIGLPVSEVSYRLFNN